MGGGGDPSSALLGIPEKKDFGAAGAAGSAGFGGTSWAHFRSSGVSALKLTLNGVSTLIKLNSAIFESLLIMVCPL